MARITLSALVSDIKGSINGNTFQRGQSGLILRNKPIPVGKGSNAQHQVRNINAQLSVLWAGLSDAQRLTWSSFAVFINGNGLTNKGRKAANTGKTQFYAINYALLNYGKSPVLNPTFVLPLPGVTPCPPFYTESSNLMNYEGSLDTNTEILVTRVSYPQSLATKTANTGFRTLVYPQVDGSEQDWAQAYFDTFGFYPVIGKKYWISLQKINFITGAMSVINKQLVLYTANQGIGVMAIGTTFQVA